MDHCNIQACEIVYRLDSGKAFRVTKTQLEPQEVRTEDLLTRRLSRSSLDIFEGQHSHVFPLSYLLSRLQIWIMRTWRPRADSLAACQEQVVIV